ncbi:MAG: radical SAM protein, partial [Elusimicrobiota bacterium]
MTMGLATRRRLRELRKGVRYGWSFVRRRLVHTNLQLLYDCNFRCGICDFWRRPQGSARLSAAQVAAISEKLDRIGPQIVSIGGGEPLLHPEIVEVVRVLALRHFPVMISNGW